MKGEIIGYVVSGPCGPLELCVYEGISPHGILLHGNEATIFTDRRRIKRAIERTIRYYLDQETYRNMPEDKRPGLAKSRSYLILPVRKPTL